jgi:hypothetical protein
VTIGGSALYSNNTAARAVAGGALLSYSNNQAIKPGTNGNFTGTASSQ